MATKPTISPAPTATNGNGAAAPEKRELTPQEHLEKANRLMRKAWKMIYEDHQKAQQQETDA